MTDDQFKIWLAGFFDGEGSVGLQNVNRSDTAWRVPRISLTQKGELEIMMKIKSLYGGSLSQHVRSGCNQWSLSKASDVAKFLEDILPYIQIGRKRVRALVVLGIAKLMLDNNFHTAGGKREADEELTSKRTQLEAMFDKLGYKGQKEEVQ